MRRLFFLFDANVCGLPRDFIYFIIFFFVSELVEELRRKTKTLIVERDNRERERGRGRGRAAEELCERMDGVSIGD